MKTHFVFSAKLMYASIIAFIIVLTSWIVSDRNAVKPEPQTIQNTDNAQNENITANNVAQNRDYKENPIDDVSNTRENDTVNETIDKTGDADNSESEQKTNNKKGNNEYAPTKTDLLTRRILEPIFNEDQIITPYKKEMIVRDATETMFKLDFETIDKTNIKTTVGTSTEDILSYKDKLAIALSEVLKLDEYELNIYAQAIQENSKERFDTLKKVSDIYKKASDNILKISAPENFAEGHVDMINALNMFSSVLNAMSKGYDDPAESLAGAGNFSFAEERIMQAFNKLKIYLILNDAYNI